MTHRPTAHHIPTALRRATFRGIVLPVLLALSALPTPCRARDDQRGQSTVEYALILLGAAAIALVVVAWVTRTDAIGRLFDTVIGRVLQQAD